MYMNIKSFVWVCCIGLLSVNASAQSKNTLLRVFQKSAKTAPSLTKPAVQVSFAQAAQEAQTLLAKAALRTRMLRSPVLEPLEKNIHRFIFTISQQGQKKGFQGSGFVIAENLSGKTVLWGVTAKHILNTFNGELQITFHLPGKTVTFPVKHVISGRKYGLNAALIQLPEQAAKVARPIPLEASAPMPGETLVAYGFSQGKYQKLIRPLIYASDERLVARFPILNQPKPGFCGSPVVNAQGKLIGIETGGYVPATEKPSWYLKIKNNPFLNNVDISRISEIVPTGRLLLLLKEYYHPGAGQRTMYLSGIKVGTLDITEFVEFIRVWYQDGTVRTLERNPFIMPEMLEQWLNLNEAVQVSIQVNKNRTQHKVYRVNLKTKQVTLE